MGVAIVAYCLMHPQLNDKNRQSIIATTHTQENIHTPTTIHEVKYKYLNVDSNKLQLCVCNITTPLKLKLHVHILMERSYWMDLLPGARTSPQNHPFT